MNIHSQYTDKCSYQSFKAIPATYKKIPEFVGNIGKYVGEYVSMPEQKLFLATSALLFQPLIDLKLAEEDKKVDSAIKSASKAIAGGLTGVFFRAGFVALANYCIGPKSIQRYQKHPYIQDIVDVIQQHLYPIANQKLRQEDAAKAAFRLKQYNKTIGTLAAIIFMITYSNSKIDVPLTGLIQDFLTKVIKEKKSASLALSEVVADVKTKIQNKRKNRKQAFVNIFEKGRKIDAILKEPSTPKKANKGAK